MQDKETNYPGLSHWLWQVIPPLSVLAVLIATTSGTNLVFLGGIFIVPFLISIISVLIKLAKFKQKKYFLLRPSLTILFFSLVFVIAHWSYQIALDEAMADAEKIQNLCDIQGACPAISDGWESHGTVARRTYGVWYKYHARYTVEENRFSIYLYQGPDTGNDITGGVGISLTSERIMD